MRFVVKTDNDVQLANKLKAFNSDYDANGLTIDLNSWHAFVVLQELLKTAPVVETGHKSSSFRSLPIIDFRKNKQKKSEIFHI